LTLQPFVLVSLHGIINIMIYHNVLLNGAKLEIKSLLLTLNSFDYNNNKIRACKQKLD